MTNKVLNSLSTNARPMKLLLYSVVLLCSIHLAGQQMAFEPCEDCPCLLRQAQEFDRRGDYKNALLKYQSYRTCAPDQANRIDQAILQLLNKANSEKIKAQASERRARAALLEVEKQKSIVESALKELQEKTNKLLLAERTIEKTRTELEIMRSFSSDTLTNFARNLTASYFEDSTSQIPARVFRGKDIQIKEVVDTLFDDDKNVIRIDTSKELFYRKGRRQLEYRVNFQNYDPPPPRAQFFKLDSNLNTLDSISILDSFALNEGGLHLDFRISDVPFDSSLMLLDSIYILDRSGSMLDSLLRSNWPDYVMTDSDSVGYLGMISSQLDSINRSRSPRWELGSHDQVENVGGGEVANLDPAEKAFELKRKEEEQEQLLQSITQTGDSYFATGTYEVALEYRKRALQVSLDLWGEDHPNTARLFEEFAMNYSYLGEFQEAIPLYERALYAYSKTPGDNIPNIANSYTNLGISYVSLNKPSKAIEYLQKSLELIRASYGADHPQMAIVYNNLGIAYLKLNNDSEARNYFNSALRILGDEYPEDHPYIVEIKRNIEEIENQ